MKMILLAISLALVLGSSAQTEGNARLYAFKEPVSKGASPQKNIEEGGRISSEMPGTSFNYFIYLESSSRAYPSELWINGKAYGVSLQTINKTPVTRSNFNTNPPTETELVPASNQQVIMLKPVPAVDDKLSEKGESLAASNELVVVYRMNGKFYFNTVRNFTILEPAALQ